MRPAWKKTARVVGAASLLSLMFTPSAFAMNLPNAFVNPYDTSLPDGTITFNSPKTPGTYDNSGDYQVLNGYPLYWKSSMSKNGQDLGQYVKQKTQFPDGTEGTSIMFNDADIGNKDNGFTLVSTDMAQNDVPDWITVMQGNPEYVNKRMNDPKYGGLGSLINPFAMSQYSVIYAPSIVQWSGGRVQDLGVRVRSDGQTGDRVIKVIPTPLPTAQVTTDKPSYAAGEKVTIDLTVNDYSANEGWQPDTNGPIAQDFHAEHLSVVKPDGSTIDLPINSGGQTYPAATGDNFPYSNHPEDGALYPVPGGGSGDPNTPKTYNETATLDTTGLPEGTYTVKLVASDSVNRRTTATTTFTIGQQQATLSYQFGNDYSAQYNPNQPADFTQGLTLTLDPNSVPKDLKAAPNDKFQFFYKVDNRDWMPLSLPAETVNVFDSTGKPKSTINITTDMLSVIPFRTWPPNETHKIQVKVTAAQGDALSYRFSSQDSGTNQPEAVVTITFTSKVTESKPPSVPKDWLDLRWGSDLPRQVNRLSNFSAPVVVSNNGDEPKTTTLKFEMTGTFCVRHVDVDPDTGKETVTYRNYPITETTYKTVTVGPHGVAKFNFSNAMTYSVNYDGPTHGKYFYEEPLDGFTDLAQLAGSHAVTNQPLNSEAPGPVIVGYDKSGNPIYDQPTYAIYLKVTAQDPEDYIEPSIDTWIGVIGPNTVPPKKSVHLVQ